ncbi:unnamed protein product, partial [Mesorhabditis belari]|uniref:Uncharacterized protein n=1 Tax=Mesorhabditis belari TaxID=2138241 RepID=A0AAF3EJ25_9BILA
MRQTLLCLILVCLIGSLQCQEPSGLRYPRYFAACNSMCRSAKPIYNLQKCCQSKSGHSWGFCTGDRQAICMDKDVTYLNGFLFCLGSCEGK